ncbi:MAG TPA: DUF5919 domain-containing protein [Longimicrobium sp.]|jgi:hypothetical protein|uniref:DUF5919 domain-containing protein n=1 Tax=Longimicrobium sp. TaxID=2029185 RepID=UPI002EDA6938
MMKPWYLLAGMALAGIAVLAWANPVRNLEAIAVNVGTGLVGTALAFLLLNYYLPRISNAYGKRTEGITYSAIAANIARSRYRVRILSTFVYPLTSHSDYRELHDEFVNALATALRANGRLEVRILILDPASDAAKQRSEERDDDVIRRIRENLLAFHRLRSGQEVFRRIDVKLFDRLPPLSMFEWDDRASMSFYPRNKAITETSRFDFSTSTPLGTFMDDTFDDVWTDEKTRALDDYIFLHLRFRHFSTVDHRAYYVEVDGRTWVLLNRERDATACAVVSGHAPGLEISMVRDEQVVPCAYAVRDDTAPLRHAAKQKYGAFDADLVVEIDRPVAS